MSDNERRNIIAFTFIGLLLGLLIATEFKVMQAREALNQFQINSERNYTNPNNTNENPPSSGAIFGLSHYELLSIGVLVLQCLILAYQAHISSVQTKIQKAQASAAHRPSLKIRGVELATEPHSGPRDGRIPQFIEFVIFNAGASPALILEGNVETYPMPSSQRAKFFIPRGGKYMAGREIFPGDAFEQNIEIPLNHESHIGREAMATGIRLVFRGGFTYKDDAGNTYRMAFAKVLDPTSGTFRPAPYADAEYDD